MSWRNMFDPLEVAALDVQALLPRRPRPPPPPRAHVPTLAERGVLIARACAACGTAHRALWFAPPDAPCRACVARSSADLWQPGLFNDHPRGTP